MSRLTLGIALLIAVLLIGLGCSTHGNPVSGNPQDTPAIENIADNHGIAGVFNVTFDPGTQEFSVDRVRESALYTHYNVTNFLSMCDGGCLKFYVLNTLPDGWYLIAAQIRNPSSLTVYDPRLLLADLYGKQVDQVDGYTTLFPGVGTSFKPFCAWAKAQPQRQAKPGFVDAAGFKLKFNPGSRLDSLIIVEVSFDSNIEEPYDIVPVGLLAGYLTPTGDTLAKVGVRVLDHQNDVEWVRGDFTLFNGLIGDFVYDDLTQIWGYEFANANRLPLGTYKVLIQAHSPNAWNVDAYKSIDIEVVQTPGARILYFNKKLALPNKSEIHSIYTDGTKDIALTSFNANTTGIGISKDLSTIIYDSDRLVPNTLKANKMKSDGTENMNLFKSHVAGASANGSVILLLDNAAKKMWVYKNVTGELYELPQANVTDCALAANGMKIGYTASVGIEAEVFACDILGMGDLQLTHDGAATLVKQDITINDDGSIIAYAAFDPDTVQNDMEIFKVSSMMADSQVNLTNNESIDDSQPQIDGAGRVIVYVSNDRGAANIMMWDLIAGIKSVTTDSIGPTMVYQAPDITSLGDFIVFEKFEALGSKYNIMAYDMALIEPTLFQVTTDGMGIKPFMSAN